MKLGFVWGIHGQNESYEKTTQQIAFLPFKMPSEGPLKSKYCTAAIVFIV